MVAVMWRIWTALPVRTTCRRSFARNQRPMRDGVRVIRDLHKSQVAPGAYRHDTVTRSRESDSNVIINHAHVCIL
jgi:hypothetical protein